DDVAALEEGAGRPQRLVEATKGRAAVAGDEPGGVQAGGQIPRALHEGKSDQGLNAAEVDAAARGGVPVVQAEVRKSHEGISLLRSACATAARLLACGSGSPAAF